MASPTDEPDIVTATTNTTADYIDGWPELWMAMAVTMSRKSKDHSKVGAVIVRENLLLASGFNGYARPVLDDLDVIENDKDEKLRNTVHAELNAILNAAHVGVAVKGATIYVNKFPCYQCLLAIVQAGIAGVYTDDTWYWNNDPADSDHSRKRSLIRQAKLRLDAPFHPDFAPKRAVAIMPSFATPPITDVPLVRKPARRAGSKADVVQPGLFREPKNDSVKKR